MPSKEVERPKETRISLRSRLTEQGKRVVNDSSRAGTYVRTSPIPEARLGFASYGGCLNNQYLTMEFPSVAHPVYPRTDPLLLGILDPAYECAHGSLPGDPGKACDCH